MLFSCNLAAMFREPKRQMNDPVFGCLAVFVKKKHRGVETGPEELMVLLYVSESDKIEVRNYAARITFLPTLRPS